MVALEIDGNGMRGAKYIGLSVCIKSIIITACNTATQQCVILAAEQTETCSLMMMISERG